jgi:Fur family ferric uptake transcriptional regulator
VPLPAVEVSQSPENKFREYLTSRPKPQRFTDQQRDMVRYIFSQHNHFDADQLIDDFDVGTRTVYEHDYGYPQHEHMVCERCGKMIEFQSEAIQSALKDVTERNQFLASGHTLVVRGVCAECNRARNAKRRLDLI